MDFRGSGVIMFQIGKSRPVARFQAGFLSSEDFHRIFNIFTDFQDLHTFSLNCLLAGLLAARLASSLARSLNCWACWKECLASWLCWKEA